MTQKTYVCKECNSQFIVKYFMFKPSNVKCSNCGSNKTEVKKSSCGCGGGNNNWIRFT
ncbi:MAG: zinc ribbon domain-containing protein [Desulfotomaculum sp.]|nr:zinc ribbon domain-containing protein [Desulfotomaculum sp.]